TLAKRISESKSELLFAYSHLMLLLVAIRLCRKHLIFIDLNLQPVKLKSKAADLSGKAVKPFSNKENYKRPKDGKNLYIISNSSSFKNGPNQNARQKNLNKYNRIMTKIYSQRLKTETLKGKVNHQRHEILINS
ncbi:hypothetical protein CEXT_13201, partial [Caerostris extrusa]